ncbi:MAG: response regulator transcription factor [Chloroflexi bacterium]|nr:response regulator transcription factor [Chloroflexota bacterium]
MYRLLVVDDEDDIRDIIRSTLEAEDYAIDEAANGREALVQVERNPPDAIILDVMMPVMDGIDVCSRIRANPYTAKIPIMFLTALDDPEAVVRGLDAGGDDYLVKPFDPMVLPARVRALLRRGPGGGLDPNANSVTVGVLTIYQHRPEAEIGDITVDLTPIEHRLLHTLALNAGRPISPEYLLRDVWEYPPYTGSPNLVHVAVRRLRAKLEREASAEDLVLNVRGQGYMVPEA